MNDPLHDAYRKYFDVHTEDDFYRLDEWICRIGIGHDVALFDGPKDLRYLDRLDQAIAEIASILDVDALSSTAHGALSSRIIYGDHLDTLCAGKPPHREAIDYATNIGGPLTRALSAVEDQASNLRVAIRDTRRMIENSPNTRKSLSKINTRGIQVVGAVRDVWIAETGETAPDGAELNLATPFGEFLQIVLTELKIPGKPRSIYRAWAREILPPLT